MSVFIPISHCFDDCSFVVSLEMRKYESSGFILSFKIVLAIQGPLRFEDEFFYFHKKHHWDFDRDCIELLSNGFSFHFAGLP